MTPKTLARKIDESIDRDIDFWTEEEKQRECGSWAEMKQLEFDE